MPHTIISSFNRNRCVAQFVERNDRALIFIAWRTLSWQGPSGPFDQHAHSCETAAGADVATVDVFCSIFPKRTLRAELAEGARRVNAYNSRSSNLGQADITIIGSKAAANVAIHLQLVGFHHMIRDKQRMRKWTSSIAASAECRHIYLSTYL